MVLLAAELQSCCEYIDVSTKKNQPNFGNVKVTADPEVREIQGRLEFPPHVEVNILLLFSKKL